jgi:protein subunit release factor A
MARKFPAAELEETVIRGSRGNGGTALNTASNTVRLTHVPSGITVRVGDTRHLYSNKSIARKRLFDKVEHASNPAESKITRGIEKQKRRNAKARYRAKLKYGAPGPEADAVVDDKHD